MRPIPPSLNCQHQANTAYDKLAVISENMDKLREIEQFIFELKQWLRAYIDKVRASISAENYANLTENNVFTGINTFADVYLNNGNIYWKDEYNNDIAWIKYDKEHQILTLHVRDSELSLSPNLAITVPTDADVDNSIVTYAFLHGLLQELEGRVTITKDTTITEGSNNVPTTDAVYQFVIGNQFHLTLEDSVLENSSNGVKSSGIYTALQELQSQIDALTEELSESRGDLFDILKVEHGFWSHTDSTYGSTSVTLTAGHIYKVVKCGLFTEVFATRPVKISAIDIDKLSVVRILTPALEVIRAIRPTEDVTISSQYGNTMTIREYTPVDLSSLSTEFDSSALGWGYTTE
jgi:hypothetical protein